MHWLKCKYFAIHSLFDSVVVLCPGQLLISHVGTITCFFWVELCRGYSVLLKDTMLIEFCKDRKYNMGFDGVGF